jgi:hypothetical protein
MFLLILLLFKRATKRPPKDANNGYIIKFKKSDTKVSVGEYPYFSNSPEN